VAKNSLIAIEPKSFPEYEGAVASAGGVVSELTFEVGGLIWTDYSKPEELEKTLLANPQLEWVQLPFAGVDAFANQLHHEVLFTSAKGAYREPVAEHALALALALGRQLPKRVRADRWGKREAFSFYDAEVLIVGGGGIAEELVRLLEPFRAKISVVRNRTDQKFPAPSHPISKLPNLIREADLVIIACALTDQTRGLFNLDLFRLFKPSAFLVNVARGPIVVTEDLLLALDRGLLAGAGLDVTDPEPLPSGHPLFGREDLIVTPHTADTKEIVTRLFAKRVEANVAAYLGNGQFIGIVDPILGY
jgi:phosphoglycerate dehydrogenase-like enzyme